MFRIILLCFTLLVASCSPAKLLTKAALGGGGPQISANVGKDITQQVVANQETSTAGRDIINKVSSLEASKVDQVNIQQTPIWMIVLLVLGWLLPSPNEISRWIRGLFKRV